MKRKISLIIVGALVALLSFLGVSAYAGGHGGGGGHGGFSGGGHASFGGGGRAGGVIRGYSGAGISRSGGSYGTRHYSSGISTGRYGSYRGYGQNYYFQAVCAVATLFR